MNMTNRRIKNIALIAGLIVPVVGFLIVLRGSTWSGVHKTLAGVFSAFWLSLFVFALLQAPPTVSITNMQQLAGGLRLDANTKRIEGTISPASAVLLINGKQIATAADGSFRYDVPLLVGDNTVTITVQDGDKETAKTFHIYRLTEQDIARLHAAQLEQSAYAAQTLEVTNSSGNVQQSTRTPATVATDRTIRAMGGTAAQVDSAIQGTPKTVFGDGTFVVGKDIAAGTYKTVSASLLCTLQRLTSSDGLLGNLLSGDLSLGSQTVTLSANDGTIQSHHCGAWSKI